MINLKISTGILILISVIILLLIIACVAYIIYKDRKQDREEIDDIIDDLMGAKPRKEENLINAKIEIPIGIKKEEEVIEETENKKMDLEAMLEKMQKSLDMKQEEVVANFENEQEEKAIISYTELVQNMNQDSFKEDIEKHESEQEAMAEENIYEQTKLQVKEFLMKEEPALRKIESPVEEKSKKFKNTDFISPIFGKMNSKIEYPKIKLFEKPKTDIEMYFEEETENKEDYKHAKIDYAKENFDKKTTIEEVIDMNQSSGNMKKNDEFLKALKKFRGNL